MLYYFYIRNCVYYIKIFEGRELFMKQERNYTIEFVRFLFAINFLLIHVYGVVPRVVGAEPSFASMFDTIIPFMAFSGFFLMQTFQKSQKKLGEPPAPPSRQAWGYLKARLISLMPLFVFATLAAVIGNCLVLQIPVVAWPRYFIDVLCEFFGLQITGFGYGNAFVGTIATRPAGIAGSMANGPLWFMSGIFVCGYLIYYLLAKYKHHFVGFIAPLTILLYYGSSYMTDTLPMWTTAHHVGDFAVASGFLNMFCGMSLGVLFYVACDNLRGKEWSAGMKVILTGVQVFCTALLMVRTWVSATSPIYGYLDFGWGVTFLVSSIFTFLCLLNVDYFTRLPLFASKLWKTPGRLAMYVYMLHYPIILFVTRALGITKGMGETYTQKIALILVLSIAVSIAAGYAVMKFEQKVLRPWLDRKPWYSKRQRELEKQLETAAR